MKYPCIIPITDGPMGYGVSPFDNCQAGYVLYQCPGCGRTTRHALISIYMPNTTCTCNFPTVVYIMNVIGSWKHPNWVEFDERSYWEDKGLITKWEGSLCQEEVIEMGWKMKMEVDEMAKQFYLRHVGTKYAQGVEVITPGKSPSLITQMKGFWKDCWTNLRLS